MSQATPTTLPQRPKLNRLFRMQWEEVQGCHVLLYPEGMVKLNQSAAEILKRCDGTHSVPSLIADLENTFQTTGLQAEVEAMLAEAQRRNWILEAAA